MIIYKRIIGHQLLRLRLLFIILFTSCIFAFKYSFSNLGYFITIVLISISVIIIRNIIVFPDNFHIVKYYFFGFLKIKWKFEKTDHLRIKSYGSDFGTKGDYADQDVSATELGCLFSILSIFMESEISKKEIRIERLSVIEKVISRVDIKVDIDEYKLLKGFVD